MKPKSGEVEVDLSLDTESDNYNPAAANKITKVVSALSIVKLWRFDWC